MTFRLNHLMFWAIAAVFLLAGNCFALGLGTDITVWDKNSTNQDWHGQGEDQEVEPGMAHGQIWDLEGFFLDGSSLFMVGGYDFIHGESGGTSHVYTAGDIFIDVNGDAVYGKIFNSSTAGNKDVLNTYGFDYVLDMDFDSLTYDVYQIDATSIVRTAYYAQNQGSNPWRYVSGGSYLESGTIQYNQHTQEQADFLDAYFAGDGHNVVGVDIGFLPGMVDATFHSTMQCGNDNLIGIGQTAPVPEPSTILLLVTGLVGMVAFRKRAYKK